MGPSVGMSGECDDAESFYSCGGIPDPVECDDQLAPGVGEPDSLPVPAPDGLPDGERLHAWFQDFAARFDGHIRGNSPPRDGGLECCAPGTGECDDQNALVSSISCSNMGGTDSRSGLPSSKK